jgi:DNA-binding NtrC family response regulator
MWLGNVRELESTIKYMLAVRIGNTLSLSDLPDRKFFEEEIIMDDYDCEKNEVNLNDEMISILKSIKFLQSLNISVGREKIKEKLNEEGLNLTESKIRIRLDALEKLGFINKRRGKHATVLTDKGIQYIKNK